MANLERTLEFGRQQPLKTGLRRLDGNALVTLPVDGFIDNSHSTFADDAHDLEAALDNLGGFKGPSHNGEGDQRLLQEAAHALFPV